MRTYFHARKYSIKFRYCEKAEKIWKNLPLFKKLFSNVKTMCEIFFQFFLAFSEYLNFT